MSLEEGLLDHAWLGSNSGGLGPENSHSSPAHGMLLLPVGPDLEKLFTGRCVRVQEALETWVQSCLPLGFHLLVG